MSRNGSGAYSLPAGNPVTTGTTISSTVMNNALTDIASALTDSLAKDGQTTPTANLPMGGYAHTGVADATARTQYAKVSQIQDGGYVTLASVSGADTITATCAPAITAYAAGQFFTFVSAGANTGAVTLNINSLGAKAVTKEGTTALAAGEIASGAVVCVEYDGTRFQIVGGRSVQPLDALLTALAGQTTAANRIQAYSGADTPTLLTTGTASGNVPIVGNESATTTVAGLVRKSTTAENAAGTGTGVVAAADLPTAVAALSISVGTKQDSTSGVAIDFIGIPATAKRITIVFSGFSTNGSSLPLVRIGDSGGFEATGYLGGAGADGVSIVTTVGFAVSVSTAPTYVHHGMITLVKIDGNTWVSSGASARSDLAAGSSLGGSKTLSDTLTQVRVTTESGDTLDAGMINILVE